MSGDHPTRPFPGEGERAGRRNARGALLPARPQSGRGVREVIGRARLHVPLHHASHGPPPRAGEDRQGPLPTPDRPSAIVQVIAFGHTIPIFLDWTAMILARIPVQADGRRRRSVDSRLWAMPRPRLASRSGRTIRDDMGRRRCLMPGGEQNVIASRAAPSRRS